MLPETQCRTSTPPHRTALSRQRMTGDALWRLQWTIFAGLAQLRVHCSCRCLVERLRSTEWQRLEDWHFRCFGLQYQASVRMDSEIMMAIGTAVAIASPAVLLSTRP